MSHWYAMACVDCREFWILGNAVPTAPSGRFRFGGWLDDGGRWLDGDEIWRYVEHYLLLHRGHEIRVVSEEYITEVDPAAEHLTFLDPDEVLAPPIEPKPDPFDEWRSFPEDLRARIQRGPPQA